MFSKSKKKKDPQIKISFPIQQTPSSSEAYHSVNSISEPLTYNSLPLRTSSTSSHTSSLRNEPRIDRTPSICSTTSTNTAYSNNSQRESAYSEQGPTDSVLEELFENLMVNFTLNV
jgi:hypothetical protein